MKYSLQLGKISGIKVQVHWTFILIILWIVYINLKAGADWIQTGWAVLFVAALFVCVILHELGHALAAKKYNISTKDITLLPIGGVARLENMPEKPVQELVVALAGPLVNILIIAILLPFVWTYTPANVEDLAFTDRENFLFKLTMVNLWLAIFNLIPAFPMDGGRVLRAVLAMSVSRLKATNIAAMIGQILSIGFVIAGFLYNPFLIFIGFFIFIGAQSEAEFTRAKITIEGNLVGDIIMHDYPVLLQTQTIRDAVHKILNSQHKNFVVTGEHDIVGTLSRDDVIKALHNGMADRAVTDVMNKNIIKLEYNTPLEVAYQKLQNQASLAPVYQDGHLIGVLDLENIMEFIMFKSIQEK